MDFLRQGLLSFITLPATGILLSHVIQVYLFTYSLLYLLTAILTTTNFIYSDILLRIKPISIVSFLLFWSVKLWSAFDEWMVWVNMVIAVYIGVYFYDACCNIAEVVDGKKQTTTINGALLLIANAIALIVLITLRKQPITLSSHSQSQQTIGIFGPQQTYIYLSLILIFLGINIYRMQYRSLFPVLINVLILSISLITKQLLAKYQFLSNLPIHALVYLPFIIDAQGREYLVLKRDVVHKLFLAGLYFYGFVILNQSNFHHQYFFLAVSIVLMVLNK